MERKINEKEKNLEAIYSMKDKFINQGPKSTQDIIKKDDLKKQYSVGEFHLNTDE